MHPTARVATFAIVMLRLPRCAGNDREIPPDPSPDTIGAHLFQRSPVREGVTLHKDGGRGSIPYINCGKLI